MISWYLAKLQWNKRHQAHAFQKKKDSKLNGGNVQDSLPEVPRSWNLIDLKTLKLGDEISAWNAAGATESGLVDVVWRDPSGNFDEAEVRISWRKTVTFAARLGNFRRGSSSGNLELWRDSMVKNYKKRFSIDVIATLFLLSSILRNIERHLYSRSKVLFQVRTLF